MICQLNSVQNHIPTELIYRVTQSIQNIPSIKVNEENIQYENSTVPNASNCGLPSCKAGFEREFRRAFDKNAAQGWKPFRPPTTLTWSGSASAQRGGHCASLACNIEGRRGSRSSRRTPCSRPRGGTARESVTLDSSLGVPRDLCCEGSAF